MKDLSDNQNKFVKVAEEAGFEVIEYSGRHMFGRTCPAITVNNVGDFASPVPYSWDELGKGFVIYIME
jgi:hypothetical protein